MGNCDDIIEIMKAMQNKKTEIESSMNTSQGKSQVIKEIAEVNTVNRFCYDCGQFFEPDDVVVEYQLDDYADQYITWYHKECEPDKNDMIGYKSIKRIRDVKAEDIDKTNSEIQATLPKKKGNNQGKMITEQKWRALLDIIEEKQPIGIKDLLHAQKIYSAGGFYGRIEQLINDGKIEKIDDLISIKKEK
jgi:hypothetical protein